MRSHARRSVGAVGAALILAAGPATALGSSDQEQTVERAGAHVDASVRLDPRDVSGGDVAQHFVGLSIEWTLIDRYMGSSSRPGPSTTTTFAAPASPAAATAQPIIGRPQIGCSSLGVSERIRVPSPAARITTTGSLTLQIVR